MTLRYNYLLWIVRSQIRSISTQATLNQKTNHYDSLGVSSKATQADIKSAYYKLSMVYHPDKNKETEHKFRSITEAYEVLGNVTSRKLYDRGLLLGGSGVATAYDEPENKFYKSRETRSRPPAPYGRTTVYDFDEWSRAHYGATFQRDKATKERIKNAKMRSQQMRNDVKSERMVLFIGIMLGILSFAMLDTNFDKVKDNGRITSLGGANLVITRD